MNSAPVFFFALIAVASASNLSEDSAAVTQSCANEYYISQEVIGTLVANPTALQPDENVKCFIKCFFDKNNVVSWDNVVDVDRISGLYQTFGLTDHAFRANYARCQEPTFRFGDSCEGSWASFRCIHGF